ncbi:MAG: FAD/NAD(P)-binding protein [Pseudomonadota bacterium]|nr:MAG: FAD/NAD(P)-binding protein [Pseudomonadota bacterium]
MTSALQDVEPQLPYEAEVVERIQESQTIFTLRLRFTDSARHVAYRFVPGQFNMLYLYGVGEIPISIVSDPKDDRLFDHAIREVGRVTRGFAQLKRGDRIGIRGPYGHGWPLRHAEGQDVLIITGGLGCAPVVSVINYVLRRRSRFGRLTIMQGVKHADDLIWRKRYEDWARIPNTHVHIAADVGAPLWPWHVGRVTELFDQVAIEPMRTVAMLCGPEVMMGVAARQLLTRGVPEAAIWLSMERSMHCGVGLCGHCQIGGQFVCRDGPIFHYGAIKTLFGTKGF